MKMCLVGGCVMVDSTNNLGHNNWIKTGYYKITVHPIY